MHKPRQNIKVAVVGTGFIGRVHVESLRRLGNVEVVGVAGSNEQRAQTFADELNIEWAVGDYREFLQDKRIQAIHICTPNSLHFEQTMAALSAGKHVICEKPLAGNIGEARQMLTAAKNYGLLHCTVYNVRGYPQIQNMRRLREDGHFGDVWLVRGTYSQDWLLHDTDWNWRVVEGESRAFGDIGTHWCDLAEHITGLRISSLTANLQTFHKKRKKPEGSVETFKGKNYRPKDFTETAIDTEDFAAMAFEMGDVVRGAMTASQVSAGRKNQLTIEISGSKASAMWDAERPEELWIGQRDRPSELFLKDGSLFPELAQSYTEIPGGLSEGWDATFKQLFRRFYGALSDANTPTEYPTFEDGVRQMEIIDAVVESSRSRAWVAVRKDPLAFKAVRTSRKTSPRSRRQEHVL
jgi:predicted dehydrogenase